MEIDKVEPLPVSDVPVILEDATKILRGHTKEVYVCSWNSKKEIVATGCVVLLLFRSADLGRGSEVPITQHVFGLYHQIRKEQLQSLLFYRMKARQLDSPLMAERR